MKPTSFAIQLLVFTLACAAILFGGVHQIEIFQSDQYLSVIGIAMFALYTTGLYILSSISVKSQDKSLFTAVHLGSILFKMILTISIVMMYKKTYEPDSRLYILPFIMIYVAFTVYETYMMTKVSKMG